MRALVIEDDTGIRSFVSRGLRESGFVVASADDGIEGFQRASTENYDIVVLDLMLPGRDGFSVLKDLRGRGLNMPIICLTARDAVDDRVQGLDLGADDYLPKPFNFTELLARIRALLRRGTAISESPLTVADLHVDIMGRQVHRGGRRIDLSVREFSLLEYLVRNAGHVLSRAMILERVWEITHDPLTNVVDVHVNRLRKKVDHGFAKALIHTIRGVGYVLRDE